MDSWKATIGQESVFYSQNVDPDSRAYNYPFAWRFRGSVVDPTRLELALRRVIARHVSLHARFAADSTTGSLQMIARRLDDVEIARETTSTSNLDARLRRLAERPMNLAIESSRFAILSCGVDDVVLFVNVHHIVVDGQSIRVFVDDLVTVYGFLAGVSTPSSLHVTYVDYCRWENSRLSDDVVSRDIDFWLPSLRGVKTHIQLPEVRQKKSCGARGEHVTKHVDNKCVLESLRTLATSAKATPFAVLLTTFAFVVGKMSATDDLLVGIATENRPPDTHYRKVIGYFSRLFPLRVDFSSGELTFRQLVANVMKSIMKIMDHQHVSLTHIAQAMEIKPEIDAESRPTSLIQCMMAYEGNIPSSFHCTKMGGPVDINFSYIDSGDCQVDLGVEVARDGPGYRFEWEYATRLFDSQAIDAITERMEHVIISAALKNPRIEDLCICTLREYETVVHTWNNTWEVNDDDDDTLLPILVDRTAQRYFSCPAIEYNGDVTTYGEMIEAANHLCFRICKDVSYDGDPDSFNIGLLLTRSSNLIIALLAILKAGAAYVPLSPSHPRQRIDEILTDSNCVAVVTETRLLHLINIKQRQLINIDNDVVSTSHAPRHISSSIACIIYTSGTTGKPKGVPLRHDALVNVFRHALTYWSRDQLSRTQFSTDVTFDAHAEEIFLPLLGGGCCVVAESILDPVEGVTYVGGTASALAVIRIPPSVRVVVQGGESLTRACWENVRRVACVANTYGPTECSIECAMKVPVDGERLNCVGSPIRNTCVYIVDSHAQPLPVGCAGEIYVGGRGVSARGYLNRPGLTAGRFIANPFGARPLILYRTGDLGRWLADGTIEFIGRVDDQLKIRGMRVEPAEIESAILDASGGTITHARVVLRDGDLVAYISPATRVDIDAALRRRLPAHMIPTRYCLLDAMPLLTSGKIDRAALPWPCPASARPLRLDQIIDSYKAVLGMGIDVVLPDDDFFALGGHSLLAVRLAAIVTSKTGIDVTAGDVLRHPSPRTLADHLNTSPIPSKLPSHVPLSSDYDATAIVHSASPMQRFIARVQSAHLCATDPRFNSCFWVRFSGEIDAGCIADAVHRLADVHSILRTRLENDGNGDVRQIIETKCDLMISRLDPDLALLRAKSDRNNPVRVVGSPTKICIYKFLPSNGFLVHVQSCHALLDGFSAGILIRELVQYTCSRDGEGDPKSRLQYSQYSHWIHQLPKDETIVFWRSYLALHRFETPLPYRDTLSTQFYRSASVDSFISSSDIKPLSRYLKTSVEITLLSLLGLTVNIFARSTDVLIGYRMAGRSFENATDSLGCFYNVLPVRMIALPWTTFREHVRRVASDLATIRDNQFITCADIADIFDVDMTSVFQVAFNFEAYVIETDDVSRHINGVDIDYGYLGNDSVSSPIVLHVRPVEDGYALNWSYQIDALAEISVQELRSLYHRIQAIVTKNTDVSVADVYSAAFL
ncbi:phosphinothricin tripeptide synthase PhsB-like [Oscarella lobularis]|uniref:phosphinothricin tripeptide synthase PhsB-like n=1 Tax=Oscarella lobularis TaxID=121494 RepID=UPI003314382B